MKKEDVLPIVFSCADEYVKNLSDHKLLFICSNKHKNIYAVEVVFNSSNFLHMTGLKTNGISAKDFLKRCVNRRLSIDDFDFSDDGTTPMKLQVLPMLMCKNLRANMIGNANENRPKLYTEKLAGNIQGCMGFKLVGANNKYIPNTVLKEDIRCCVAHADRIILTYRKHSFEASYSEIVYAAKKVDWTTFELPASYTNLPLPK